MNSADLHKSAQINSIGEEMYRLVSDLYPICRSITGNGVRKSLEIVSKLVPLKIHEVPTGTQVFDWTVPKEWNIHDAYIKNSAGERVVDFRKSNLHVVSYSIPIKQKMSLAELKEHLFTLPERPDWIPYRTSYYDENWGFCLSHNQLCQLKDEEYEVCIDASLESGHLTYGEYYLEGNTKDEILISCHSCHPSLCNDNLSGVALVAFLAKHLRSLSLRYSYRFLFIPGTIGSITWLCRNEDRLFNIKNGLVVACVGDVGKLTYKKSRQGDCEIDRAFIHTLRHSGEDYEIMEFSPYGYDERQYCSPGFDLPVGCLTRTPNSHFPEYHTSADNLEFVHPSSLADSLSRCLSVISILECNKTYVNLNPKCEPQLGKRGLYRAIRGQADGDINELSLLWVLNLSDGNQSLLDISDRAGLAFPLVRNAADALCNQGLLKEHSERTRVAWTRRPLH